MLVIHPERVVFAGRVWEGVAAVAVDHAPAAGDHGTVLEYGEAGPYPIFGDVPERRVTIRVERTLLETDVASPRPGEIGELVLHAALSGSEAGRVRVRAASCMVVRVQHELAGSKGARRVVELAALSGDGATDPIEVTPAEAQA